MALEAIGNSGDEGFADTLRSYTKDTEPLVRARAARAYRRMESTTLEPVLVEWLGQELGQEQDARVRPSIADTLAEQVREPQKVSDDS